jgi:hypothetical protein
MVERTPNRPIPEGELKQNAPGARPLGIPPPNSEHSPQGGGSTSPERQPLPSALDILERRAQLYEHRIRDLRLRHHESKHTREYLNLYREHRENVEQLGDEAARLYADWSDRNRLISDLYTTSVEWNIGLSPEKTQQFIAKVQALSEEELREELRRARAVAEQKAAISKKISETHRLNSSLTPQERYEKQREKDRERSRAYQRRKREERRLQAEQQQPMQVFPDPPKE